MSIAYIIRALKDPDYRDSLSEQEREQLPIHPTGALDQFELLDFKLESVAGGVQTVTVGGRAYYGQNGSFVTPL